MIDTLYLNNDGSRWTYREKHRREFVLLRKDGTKQKRLARCFESFGNFALIVFTLKGKQYKALPTERDELSGMLMVEEKI